jgi:glycosyltransferase involved in cell wall biosynthesis
LNELREAAVGLGIDKQTRFAGRVSRAMIPEMFSAADFLVHGALIEASGNSLLEAMASGLPVVCTNAGGPAEYVMDQKTGFVVPVADPEAMAARIRVLLIDPTLREQLGRQAREWVEQHFTYDRMVQQTLETYLTVIGEVAPDSRDLECRRLATTL